MTAAHAPPPRVGQHRTTQLALVLVVVVACAGRSATPRAPSDTVRVEIERAETAERARRHDLARVHYERAVAAARDPASIAFARREFAETLATWGAIAEAIVQLEGSIAARGDDPAAWHDLGILRHKQDDHAGAVTALERARTLAPRDPRPRIALAALHWKTGDGARALVEYRGLLELDLPSRVREQVEWAIERLANPQPEGHTPRQ